jgi:hypothetical protein
MVSGRTKLLIKAKVFEKARGAQMGRPSRLLESLRTAVKQRVSREFALDVFEPPKPLTPGEN